MQTCAREADIKLSHILSLRANGGTRQRKALRACAEHVSQSSTQLYAEMSLKRPPQCPYNGLERIRALCT